jgi:hypothetical protein
MNASAVLSDLQTRGFAIGVEGTDLVIAPWSKLTDAMKHDLRQSKQGIMALLSTAPETVPWSTPAEYRAAFLREHDPYTCPRCHEPVLLETHPNGHKRYTDWFDGRPHRETCTHRFS